MAAVEYDDDQLKAIEIEPEQRQIVLAGPGAGKSEVVGALAAHLVENEGVYPEEILVISFSRAAVGVVEQRTAHVADGGERVDVRTIDSLAAQIVTALSDDEPTFKSYDHTIEQAAKLLRTSDEPALDEIRHVIVDEVQDVVGVRADFVLALLTKGVPDDTGFSLLGDPLQSLYDFQRADAKGLSCDDLLQKVRDKTNWDVRIVALEGDYRSQTDDAAAVGRARADLLRLPDGQRRRRLEAMLADLSPLGDLDADAVETIAAWTGRTALLCDTNARAALTAAQLAENGLTTETASAVLDAGLPPWIALAFAEHPSTTVGFDDFCRRAGEFGCDDPVGAWRALRDRAGVGSDLDLRRVADFLSTPLGSNRFRRKSDAPVVVSTVHRAKGLEFDNVVLVDPDDWGLGGDDDAQAGTRLYVAMSRARARVTSAEGIDTKAWRKESRSERSVWAHRHWRGRGWHGLLLEPWMARALGPSASLHPDLVGRQVRWEPAEAWLSDGEEWPCWDAFVDDLVVARTGEEFGRLIARVTRRLPPELSGGRVDGLETTVGPPSTHGTGRHGLWLTARISGPVDFDWK